jgi:hypothetical protein
MYTTRSGRRTKQYTTVQSHPICDDSDDSSYVPTSSSDDDESTGSSPEELLIPGDRVLDWDRLTELATTEEESEYDSEDTVSMTLSSYSSFSYV